MSMLEEDAASASEGYGKKSSVLPLYERKLQRTHKFMDLGKAYPFYGGMLRKIGPNHTEFVPMQDHPTINSAGVEKLVWDTRSTRKGRYPYVTLRKQQDSEKTLGKVAPTTLDTQIRKFVPAQGLTLLTVEPGNISWWVAHIFTWGSVLWVVNGVYVLLVETTVASFHVAAWSAFFGALVFEFGAYAGVLEALNPNRREDFGLEVWREFHQVHGESTRSDFSSVTEKGAESESSRENESLLGKETNIQAQPRWKWFALEFDTKAKRSALVQLFGATLFLISSTVALPKYSSSDEFEMLISSWILQDIFIWMFQVIGSLCFLYGALILMLETQLSTCQPNLKSLGWHICFWNAVGALGFLLCAIFGLLANVNGEEICCQRYGTALSTFWGSLAFLIGSLLLVYEVSNKHRYYKQT